MLVRGARAVARQAHSSIVHHLMKCLVESIILGDLEGLMADDSNIGSQLLPLEEEKEAEKRS